MENKDADFEIAVTAGPGAGARKTVSAGGIRFGRSSTCELAVPDPALSRNQCLFEMRDGRLLVTDLASANGTTVNGEALDDRPYVLSNGDVIEAGDTVLRVESRVAASGSDDIDLGFSAAEASAESTSAENGTAKVSRRTLLWVVAAAVVIVAAAAVLLEPTSQNAVVKRHASVSPVTDVTEAANDGELVSVVYESVRADASRIFRYAIELDGKGEISVRLDDVPANNRHLLKPRARLSTDAMKRLADIFSDPEFFRLESEYAGASEKRGETVRRQLRVIKGKRIADVTVENAAEPPPFAAARTKLEAIVRNELGIWAVEYSGEKLTAMAREAKAAADAKWEERDVKDGNLAAALASYNEARTLLETVSPKPDFYDEIEDRRNRAKEERDRRYADRRFAADRAINLQDWRAAQRELRILLELVPELSDPRHGEANAKLLDVEARLRDK